MEGHLAGGGSIIESNISDLAQYKDSIADRFDKIYKDVKNLEDGPGITREAAEKIINQSIKDLEEITRIVSELNLFSTNEDLAEINPTALKFLLLPYLLCILWQMKTGCDRKEVCRICKIYLEDFIERILDYSIIPKPPTTWLRSKNWSDDPEENAKPLEVPGFQTAEQKRAHKIEQYKRNKQLDDLVNAYDHRIEKGEELDDESYRDLYLTIIKRAVTESESLLDNILREMEMLNFKSKSVENGNVPTAPRNPALGPGVPYQTFILTRTEQEKKVFGIGYPAIPAMTVAQLYEQRIADGTWSQGHEPQKPPPDEDADAVTQELAEEIDDLNLLETLRARDEYRDDHRRGWGNRMNRS